MPCPCREYFIPKRHSNRSAIKSRAVGMSKPPKVASRPAGGLRGAVSAPAGYGAAPRSKTYVGKLDPRVLYNN